MNATILYHTFKIEKGIPYIFRVMTLTAEKPQASPHPEPEESPRARAAAPPHAYLAILVESRARVVTAGSDRSFFL